MSGPLSSNEIEDVVSSVRRLVSTDQRPRPPSRDLGQDKLILTPALRVVTERTAPAEPLILTGLDRAADPATSGGLPPDPVASQRFQPVEAEWEDELWAAPEPKLAELALGAEEAELVIEPAPAPAAMWPESDAPPAPWTEVEADWAEDAPPPVTAAPLRAEDQAEPDSAPEIATSAGDEIDVAEVLTAAVVEEEGFHVMDEQELHALVRSMVRSELQGSLGERITRNVRKLVRAEINRALTARALD